MEERRCNRCNSKVEKSDLKEYSYQCFDCDEDLYTFETYVNKEKVEVKSEYVYVKMLKDFSLGVDLEGNGKKFEGGSTIGFKDISLVSQLIDKGYAIKIKE